VCAGAEEAVIPATADAALFCAVHDVMRSPAALANVLRYVREDGRIVAGGAKWAPWRQAGAVSLNLSTWRLNRECVSTFEGFHHPWSRIADLLPDVQVEEVYSGGGYIASATRSSSATLTALADARLNATAARLELPQGVGELGLLERARLARNGEI
jgi:hypothetical protein